MDLLETVVADIETQGQKQSAGDAWRAWDYTKIGTDTVIAGKGGRAAFTLQAQATRVVVRIPQEWLAGLPRLDIGESVFLRAMGVFARVRSVGDSYVFYIREPTWNLKHGRISRAFLEAARINFFNSRV
jgi:hypothetical protein